jgi:antitoxin component YwqK of YwqJK toxin-antitoxin module
MLEKTHYSNGQKVFHLENDYLTYYYKNGIKKAEGKFVNLNMQDEWKFYRENGDLWQIGNFKDNQKHGNFVRYDKNGEVEYNENFNNGKQLKSKI